MPAASTAFPRRASTMRPALPVLLGAVLAGCAATSGDAPAPEPGEYVARGNEPGWSLAIGARHLALATDYGRRRIAAPLPAREPLPGGGHRYAARAGSSDVRVDVAPRLCRDTMTGVPHPDTVTVILDGRALAGCGGAPETLLRGTWVVEQLDGATPGASRATLDFQPDGRLAGLAFCNHYSARYAVSGEGLRVGPAAATRKACPPPLMTLESAFLALLQAAASHDFRPDGALVITGAGGRGIIARKE